MSLSSRTSHAEGQAAHEAQEAECRVSKDEEMTEKKRLLALTPLHHLINPVSLLCVCEP